MTEERNTKLKTRLTFVTLGLALAATAAWIAVHLSTEQRGYGASHEPAVAVPVDAVPRVAASASTEAANPSTGSTAGPVSPYGPTVTSGGMPLRAAIDYGRAQPIFIALRAPANARVGESFTVDVTGESENDFARVALAVQFDPRSVRVAAVRPGDLMAQAGATAAFSYGIDAQTGRVSVEVSEHEAGNPVSGGGTLCTLEFVAMAPGPASLSIVDVAVGDLNNEGVAYSVLPPRTVAIGE